MATTDEKIISLGVLSYNNDKMKGYIQEEIDKIPSSAVDDTLSDTSEHPVQNKVINAALNSKADQTTVDSALSLKANSADVTASLAGKSDTGHTHDDRYYTESETNALLGDKVGVSDFNSHTNNTTIHVTADEKAAWNGKAEISDIPATLPANGGNADTLDGKHGAAFALAENSSLSDILEDKSGDIRELVQYAPAGGYHLNTNSNTNLTGLPLSGDILITWFKSRSPENNNVYGTLLVRSMTSGSRSVFQCSIFNTRSYTEWQKLSDYGDAATLETHPASDFVLKSDYDALAARVENLVNDNDDLNASLQSLRDEVGTLHGEVRVLYDEIERLDNRINALKN